MRGGELPWLSLLLPMLAVAIVGLFGGWLNLRWRRNLPLSATDSGWRFSLREILAAVAAISLLTGLTASFIRSTPPRYAENVSVADAPFGLPASAADVSFCQGFRGTIAYEFTVDEISFREWVADGIGSIESNASNTELEPITTPVSITRYNAYSSDLNGPGFGYGEQRSSLLLVVRGSWCLRRVRLHHESCILPVSYTHLTLPTNREV